MVKLLNLYHQITKPLWYLFDDKKYKNINKKTRLS